MYYINYIVRDIKMRLYEAKFPKGDDVVWVQVIREESYGYYGKLLEYGMEGFIPTGEVTRRRFKTLKKYVKIGDKTAFTIQKISTETIPPSIDLSRRFLDTGEKELAYDKYCSALRNVKLIERIRHAYIKYFDKEIDMETMMQHTFWKLYKDLTPKQSFDFCLEYPEKLLDVDFFEEEFYKKITENIKLKIIFHPPTYLQDFTIVTYMPDGVAHLKELLLSIDKLETPETKIKIKLKSPPVYQITVTSKNPLDILSDVFKYLTEHIKIGTVKHSCEPTMIDPSKYTLESGSFI
jgi:translation initiation factor 2 alpha subunit (eIF-2alpha)